MFKKIVASDTWRQSLNIFFALTQIIAAFILTLFKIGHSIADSSAAANTSVIPAGYAFSIWGFIFFFALLYAIYQVLPRQRNSAMFRRLGWWTAGAFCFNTIWELVAQLVTFNWPTLLIILIILVFSLGALFALPAYKDLSPKNKWLVFVPISTLAGWVSAATFANLSSVLYQVGFNNFGLSLNAFSLVIIVFAGFFSLFILYKAAGNFLYGLAIAWALNAIIVANLTRSYDFPSALAAGIFGLAILIEILFLEYASQ
jgi:hypothetical protein